jgi:hypothetical protein
LPTKRKYIFKNKKQKKRDQQEWLSSVYDSQVIERAKITAADLTLNKKITKDYEDALMREELTRWKKAFTISNSALDPPKVPVSNLDFEGGAVKNVLQKKFGTANTIEYKEFKELEADQDDRLKKFYNDSITKQETIKKSQMFEDREKEKQWFNASQTVQDKQYAAYDASNKNYSSKRNNEYFEDLREQVQHQKDGRTRRKYFANYVSPDILRSKFLLFIME